MSAPGLIANRIGDSRWPELRIAFCSRRPREQLRVEHGWPKMPHCFKGRQRDRGTNDQRCRLTKLRAFSGKVDTGFPQEMRPAKEARARFRFNLIETRSSASGRDDACQTT